MLMLNFFSWWYGRGWATALQDTRKNIAHVSDAFSVAILLRTLFSPWRRIISYPGSGLSAHLRAAADNAISRIIGFFVRIFVLCAATIFLLLLVLIGIVELIIWPALPFAAVGLIVWGIV